MADIDIQRRTGPGPWVWILALLLLALLLWAIFAWAGRDEAEPAAVVDEPVVTPTPTAPVPAEETAAVPPPVAQYVTTCTPPLPADMEMGRQHEFTAECIERLAASLEAVTQRDQVAGTDVSQKLQTARQQAQNLRQSEATATSHAGTTRDAFTAAADLIEATHQAGYQNVPGLGDEVSQVRQAAESVQPQTPMLEQKDAVHAFFREAGEAVRRMAETPAARG